MVGLQTLDLAIGVRVPASQPNKFKQLRAISKLSRPFCAYSVPAGKTGSYCVPGFVNNIWYNLSEA